MFQAEFGVPEEEPEGPWVGPLKRLGDHTPTVTSTPPRWLPNMGCR